jgi:hypothetical protein
MPETSTARASLEELMQVDDEASRALAALELGTVVGTGDVAQAPQEVDRVDHAEVVTGEGKQVASLQQVMSPEREPALAFRSLPRLDVPAYDGAGYADWRETVFTQLSVMRLDQHVLRESPLGYSEAPDWERQNRLVALMIRGGLSQRVRDMIGVKPTAMSLWLAVEQFHRSEVATRGPALARELFTLSQRTDESLTEFGTRARVLARDVMDAGMTVPDSFVIASVLSGLRPDWEHFRDVQRALRPSTMAGLMTALAAQERERPHCQVKSESAMAALRRFRQVVDRKPRENFGGKCHYCDCRGHRVADCPDKRSKGKEPREDSDSEVERAYVSFVRSGKRRRQD